MGLSGFEKSTDLLTMNQVCLMLGVQSRTVKKKWKNKVASSTFARIANGCAAPYPAVGSSEPVELMAAPSPGAEVQPPAMAPLKMIQFSLKI